MKFQVYCSHCTIRVTASTMLMGNELHLALHSDVDIAVVHATDVEHQWKLLNREKMTLRDRIAAGNPVGAGFFTAKYASETRMKLMTRRFSL